MSASGMGGTTARQLLAYGLPGLPLAALTLPVYIFVPTLYAQSFGISLVLIGVILLGARVFDAITDPLIGVLSDRTPGRLGRRKPWLVIGTPFTLIALFALFIPPDDAGAMYLLTWSFILTLSWTAMVLPYNAWGAELSADYDTRTRITAVREAFVLVGTMLAAGLPAALSLVGITALTDHARVLTWIVVGLLPLTIFAAVRMTPEGPVLTSRHAPWRDALGTLARNKAFSRLILAYFVNATANGLPASLFILFVTHRLEMPGAYGPLLFAYFMAGLTAIPFWVWLSNRIGKHRAWVVAMLWACAAFVPTPFVVGAGDIEIFLVISILSGMGVGADLVLPPSINADVVDVDILETGEQRTGLFFAIWGMVTKLALGLAVGIAFPLLALAGFDAQAQPGTGNSSVALMTLALLYALVPVLLKLVAIWLMWFFPLTRTRQKEIRESI